MMVTQLNRCVFVLILAVCCIPNANAETQDQQLTVALRTIGHEFLLQLNDSTSRILPIEKIDGRYAMHFESAFAYMPDLLIFATIKTLEGNKIAESFIVEVEQCGTKDVVHSFKASLKNDDTILSCNGRVLPKDCYIFYFTVFENNISVQLVAPAESSEFKYLYAVLIIIIVVFLIVYLIKRNRNHKLNPELISIGQFQFDKKGMILILKAQIVELSSKESDLLYLLFSNENKTLEREYLLKVVWGDEGDYVGRTLDVFISKLRKKLEADRSVKIINIRGVGYRFVIN